MCCGGIGFAFVDRDDFVAMSVVRAPGKENSDEEKLLTNGLEILFFAMVFCSFDHTCR